MNLLWSKHRKRNSADWQLFSQRHCSDKKNDIIIIFWITKMTMCTWRGPLMVMQSMTGIWRKSRQVLIQPQNLEGRRFKERLTCTAVCLLFAAFSSLWPWSFLTCNLTIAVEDQKTVIWMICVPCKCSGKQLLLSLGGLVTSTWYQPRKIH